MAGLSDGRRRFLLRRRVTPWISAFLAWSKITPSSRHCFSESTSSLTALNRSDRFGESLEELPSRTVITIPGARYVIFGTLAPWILAFLFSAVPAGALAQVPSNLADTTFASRRVAEIGFAGDLFFDEEQLALHVRTRPNRTLLGIPGFTWWLWLHQFGAKTIGGKVGRAFQAMGEPPARLDSMVVSADVERLRLFYEREGFREADVASLISPVGNTDKVLLEFLITAGPPTFIRTIHYNGLEALSKEQQDEIMRASLLPPEVSEPENPLHYRPASLRYSEPLLELERGRLMASLRNAGYASVIRDSIHAVVWPAYADSFDVTIDIRTGPRYRFGDLSFVVSGPETGATERTRSEHMDSFEEGIDGGTAAASFNGESKLKFSLLRRTLRFRPGDWYDYSLLLATKRRLDATGVFAFTEMLPGNRDSTRTDATRINYQFNVQTRLRHQISLQTFMLQRSGALADTDNELGAGLGITYNNLNLFGGGERFQLSTSGSLAADLGGRGGYTSAQWEVAASLSYPYLTFPLGALDRYFNLYEARTRLSISLLAARRDALRLILRGRGLARYRFELRHTRTLASYVDLVDITVSNPDTLAGFQEIFLNDILQSIDDPIQRAQILEDYTRPQFNNALRYTFRSANIDPFRRSEGYAYEAAFEIGGNMGFLLDRYVFTPGEIDGDLPGLPFFKGNGSSARMIYRQYLRFSADFRRYIRFNARSVVAGKFILGLAQPTGRSDVIPFDRRFYSGGASSVRAWRLRELGPGAASFKSEADTISTETTNILGGEIKLEGSVEVRQTFARNILAADWVLAFFVDAGNVWFGPRNPGTPEGRFRIQHFLGELGVGTGVGLRLAWDYLIVRLDLAYKVHDPLRRGNIFPDKFRDPLLQFGIGHTF